MPPRLHELARGIHRWTLRHPEWHPKDEFGAEVGSYALALADGETLLLVDPLLDDAVATALDPLVAAADRLLVYVTIPYHVRSTEQALRRWGADRPTTVHGHPAVARRLPPDAPFHAATPGEPLAHGLTAYRIGSPARKEQPLHVPDHDALLVGDAIVGTDPGRLGVWLQHDPTPQRESWYRDRLIPTLRQLADRAPERILVTHGEPVLAGGAAALEAALAAPPWFHPPR